MADSVNENLQDRAVRHAIFLERLKTEEQNKILRMMNKDIFPDIEKELRRRVREKMSTRRINELHKVTALILREGYSDLSSELKAGLRDLAVQEGQFQTSLLNKSVGAVDVTFAVPGIQTLRAVVNTNVRGAIIDDWFKSMSRNDANAVIQQVNIGLVEGDSIDSMVRRVVGTRRNQFTDGVLQTSRRNAKALVRTSVNHVSSQAREAVYKENEDMIKGVRYVATLDSRTTDICASLDGRVFPIGEGERPPMHFQCRSTTVPIVKSWKELGIPLREAPPGTRASVDGQVPDNLTYPKWLKKQPIAVQNEVLGVGKAKVFRRGKVSIDRFVDKRNKSLTLKQLESLENSLEK